MGDVPKPTERGLKALRKMAKRIQRTLPHIPAQGLYDLALSYTGAKRRKYTEATDKLLRLANLGRRDAGVKMFVKCEKIEFSSSKPNPDPRAIQFRDLVYNCAVGRFLKPLEHYLYNLTGTRLSGLPPTRVIGKGLNQGQRADLLILKMSRFVRPVVLSIDASRFDQHVDIELLKIEHSFYLAMNSDPEFRTLLSYQLVNHGISSRGIRYKTRGKRMSGDMNTALGNCVLMVLMVATFLGGRKYDLLDDGDDCLVIVEEEDLAWVKANITQSFLDYGMEIKVDAISKDVASVEWCQGHILRCPEPRFVRNPYRVMSRALTSQKFLTSVKGRAALMNTIGLCELVLNRGVPVLQEYCLALIRASGTKRVVSLVGAVDDNAALRVSKELSQLGLKELVDVTPIDICDHARQDFAVAWGVDISTQFHWENELRNWNPSVLGDWEQQFPIDVPRWEYCDHNPDCSL
uniref:RNA-directed RNA polymerase n=1 Tax=Riboviria sp. TaxID=2585031 RepID=A0A514D758_9VIRU|nr:MAG: RNA-dependent RNA polymerase [Riboviria sp.]